MAAVRAKICVFQGAIEFGIVHTVVHFRGVVVHLGAAIWANQF